MQEETLQNGMRIWSARPEGDEPRPAVIYLHERYGPVQHSMDVIERLAANGIVGVAPDMFYRYTGDRAANERAETRYDLKDADSLADLDQVMAWLRTQSYVIDDEVGAAK